MRSVTGTAGVEVKAARLIRRGHAEFFGEVGQPDVAVLEHTVHATGTAVVLVIEVPVLRRIGLEAIRRTGPVWRTKTRRHVVAQRGLLR
jgi:hypothetical protein